MILYHDDRRITDCPMCRRPLPTEVMQPDADAEDNHILSEHHSPIRTHPRATI